MTAALLAVLKGNKEHIAWSVVALAMVTGAYLAQSDRLELQALELGELRATVKYQEMALESMADLCD